MSTLPAAPAAAAPAAVPAAAPPSPGLPAALHALGWLLRDTFRQAVATGILALVLTVTGLCVLGCLSVGVTGGELTLAFGAVRLPMNHDPANSVRFVQVVLALGVADGLGLLLILVWTAGFLPAFVDPAAAAVMLAKPVPRWSLLAGKYLGVLAFVGVNAVLFVGGTWLALGLRTGVWDAAYFWCVPLLLAHFAVFFSVSTLLAVATRSP